MSCLVQPAGKKSLLAGTKICQIAGLQSFGGALPRVVHIAVVPFPKHFWRKKSGTQGCRIENPTVQASKLVVFSMWVRIGPFIPKLHKLAILTR